MHAKPHIQRLENLFEEPYSHWKELLLLLFGALLYITLKFIPTNSNGYPFIFIAWSVAFVLLLYLSLSPKLSPFVQYDRIEYHLYPQRLLIRIKKHRTSPYTTDEFFTYRTIYLDQIIDAGDPGTLKARFPRLRPESITHKQHTLPHVAIVYMYNSSKKPKMIIIQPDDVIRTALQSHIPSTTAN